MTNDYLDVGIVTVKPEKRGEFESIIKKMVEANRKHQGDYWLTTEMMFGPGNTFTYVSPRQNYAGVEQGFGNFMGALQKSLGRGRDSQTDAGLWHLSQQQPGRVSTAAMGLECQCANQ